MPTPVHVQLAHIRKRAKLKQATLAKRIGWSDHTQVSHIERGMRGTGIDDLERWAAECGHEVVLVPLDTEDPEGLRALIDSLEDPFARSVVADFVRLAQMPGAPAMMGGFRDEFAETTARLLARAERMRLLDDPDA